MSSETDHPRQRTVAELLAAHGETGATGRRHRRRAPEAPDDGGSPPEQAGGPAFGGDLITEDTFGAASFKDAATRDGGFGGNAAPGRRAAPPGGPDRAVLREPVPREPVPDRAVLREPVPHEPAPPQQRAMAPEPVLDAPRPVAPPPARRVDRRDRAERPYAQPTGQFPPQQATGSQALDRGYGPPPSNGGPANGAPANGSPLTSSPLNGAPVNGGPLIGASPNGAPPNGAPTNGAPANGVPTSGVPVTGSPAEAYAPPAERPAVDHATEQLPRVRDGAREGARGGTIDPGLTGPIDVQRLSPAASAPAPAGPASEWAESARAEKAREAGRQDLDDGGEWAADADGGPATMVGAAPTGAESWHRKRTGRRANADDEGGPPTQASTPMDFDHPAGLGSDLDDDEYDDDELDAPQRRRLGRGAGESSPGQAWAAVVAQWIIGAIGGAALWVGFRFLWRELPVVALAAAVLVTIGLVVVVRALLRNNDMRTTLFAVGVGLLLTVSPAILVLLGR
ncbi:hypothetical protein [Pseudonocardia sp. GCM10023141]|uniref:hypothetical protein n=1 Tax=Pseudonocardia sp. GCM10023141 TaxID=3252653 RepID=UPI00361229C7